MSQLIVGLCNKCLVASDHLLYCCCDGMNNAMLPLIDYPAVDIVSTAGHMVLRRNAFYFHQGKRCCFFFCFFLMHTFSPNSKHFIHVKTLLAYDLSGPCFVLQTRNTLQTRVSNIRPAAQDWPSRVFNPTSVMNFENKTTQHKHFIVGVFFEIILLFL